MIHKITGVTNKSNDWKLLTIEMGANSYQSDVSVNRTGKKGEVFPNFDAIAPGITVEGELWQSGQGKWYLFPPKVQKQGNSNFKGQQIEKAMERKEQAIDTFQDKKNEAILRAGAFRDATLVSLASLRDQPFPSDEEYKAEWKKWVKYFLQKGDEPFV